MRQPFDLGTQLAGSSNLRADEISNSDGTNVVPTSTLSLGSVVLCVVLCPRTTPAANNITIVINSHRQFLIVFLLRIDGKVKGINIP